MKSLFLSLLLGFAATLIAAGKSGGRPDEVALNEAVRKVGGKSVDGHWASGLCKITRVWAKEMSRRHLISTSPTKHDGFSDGPKPRGQEAMDATHAMSASEILASTYGFETTLAEHAKSCVDGWAASPRHRPEMMQKHDHFCYSMEKGSDHKYYCAGLFTDDTNPAERPRR